jgi:4-aminobutyrate aminotransferase/(S)-3-amino-2-methylpropionate transaminase
METIPATYGFPLPNPGYLEAVKVLCEKYDALYIADEVQTGFARTGHMFAVEEEGVFPDMVVTAKGIAGGLPLAAVTGRAEIMDSVHVSGLGGTYGGNPLACAASLGVFETIEEENLVARAAHIGEVLGKSLRALAAKYPIIAEVRGRGAMQAIELVMPGTLDPNTAAMSAVVKYCQSKGVLVLTAGTYSNVIRFLPPVVITDELLLDAMGVLEEAFASL